MIMSVSDRYIRLFDLVKYREIQPITDGIKKRNANPTEVINLIQRAMNVVQSSEFEKHNGRNHIFIAELEDGLEIMQEKSLLDWRYHTSSDKLNVIISSICCPRYQSSPEYKEYQKADAGTVINYAGCYPHLDCFNRDLYEMLTNGRAEVLPNDIGESAEWIFTRQELTQLAVMVKQDLVTLSQPNFTLYMIIKGNFFVRASTSFLKDEEIKAGYSILPATELTSMFLEFYSELDCLLEEAITNPGYTIINEVCIR
jgi:hypothetical protein